VRLLGIAHEYNRADTHALTLLARAFDKMGLEEKARRVEMVLAEIEEEEPTLPIAVERPFMQSESGA
jgi:outer membrane protein assembly factor BamD (BamD/ComL family)